jgi:hypothetical protein
VRPHCSLNGRNIPDVALAQSGQGGCFLVVLGLLKRFSIGRDVFRGEVDRKPTSFRNFDGLRKVCIGPFCQTFEELKEFRMQSIAA